MISNGAFEAEYLLFDPGEIELRSSSYGEVREVGYRTTGKRLKPRIASLGFTTTWIDDVRRALIEGPAHDYFRGPAARRIATKMTAWQMLEGREYRSEGKQYVGTFLDFGTLAAALNVSTTVLQIAQLAAIAYEVGDAEELFLDTRGAARERRLGERTHRRVSTRDAIDLPSRLLAVSKPESINAMPKTELLATLENRTREDALAADAWSSLATLAFAREKPLKGPLSDDELWSIEVEMDARRMSNVLERLDAAERAQGKTPGTAYLRARAALEMNREPAVELAERLASLSLAVNPFPELVLLTALAWYRAGDPRRALPFARDVVATANAEPVLVRRATEIINRIERGSTTSRIPLSVSPRSQTFGAPSIRQGSTTPTHQPSAPPGSRPSATPGSRQPSARPSVPPSLSDRTRMGEGRTLPAPDLVLDPAASRGFGDEVTTTPRLVQVPTDVALSNAPSVPGPPQTKSTAQGRYSVLPRNDGRVSESRVPSMRADPRAEIELSNTLEAPPRSRGERSLEPPRLPSSSLLRAVTNASQPPNRPSRELEMPQTIIRESAPDPLDLDSAAPTSGNDQGSSPPVEAYMAGSAKPFFKLDAREVRAPLRKPPHDALLLEGLSLGSDVHNVPPPNFDVLPKTALDARALFTVLTRELGAEYRRRFGLELVTDLKSLEIVQTYLRDTYPHGKLDTPEALFDVYRHGAFVSEVLARWFDAEWDDMSYEDVGLWSMFVPTRHRVWPFGRVLRFVRKGHRERDLVSYVLELELLRRNAVT